MYLAAPSNTEGGEQTISAFSSFGSQHAFKQVHSTALLE